VLRVHRSDDVEVRVADTGDAAAGGIDVVIAGLVAKENTLARHRCRVAIAPIVERY
jgi:hypothetical protein